jgi:hypothetical protein
MARYIDADKLIEHIKDLPTWREVLGRGWLATKYPDGTFDCEDVISSIVNAPTADVVEVKRGEWKREKLVGCEPYFLCSVCGKLHDQDYSYCNECGAKMDGGNAE